MVAPWLRSARTAACISSKRWTSATALSHAAASPASSHGVWYQSVRWMGRGPTIQGRKNATDAVRRMCAMLGHTQDAHAILPWRRVLMRIATAGDRENVVRERPTSCTRLASVISKAKAANMPKDKIDAAIKRGVDGKDGANAETVLYEGSGPGGSAFIIETLTDNKRRTAPALRHVLGKYDGSLGTNGSVSWMFELKGYLEIELGASNQVAPDEDALMEIALDAGAEDVELRDELAQVTCEPNDLAVVRNNFTKAGLEPSIVELIYNPKEFVDLSDDHRETFEKLIDALNDNEDVNQIHHNVNE